MTEQELQKNADEISGIMYKFSDCGDDATWLPSDKFHEVALKILSFIKPEGFYCWHKEATHEAACKYQCSNCIVIK